MKKNNEMNAQQLGQVSGGADMRERLLAREITATRSLNEIDDIALMRERLRLIQQERRIRPVIMPGMSIHAKETSALQ